MDDIMSALNDALSDPATMQQVNSLLSSLSAPDDSQPPAQQTPQTPAPAPDLTASLQSLLGGQVGQGAQQSVPVSAPPAVPKDMDKIVRLMGILQQDNSDNGSIGLILALKPLLKPETQPKADRVIKLIRVMNAYPLIRDSGLLDNLF